MMATGLRASAEFSTPAVVLKFDQNPMHHGGLGAIRSLGRLGVPVYGVHEGRWVFTRRTVTIDGHFPGGMAAQFFGE